MSRAGQAEAASSLPSTTHDPVGPDWPLSYRMFDTEPSTSLLSPTCLALTPFSLALHRRIYALPMLPFLLSLQLVSVCTMPPNLNTQPNTVVDRERLRRAEAARQHHHQQAQATGPEADARRQLDRENARLRQQRRRQRQRENAAQEFRENLHPTPPHHDQPNVDPLLQAHPPPAPAPYVPIHQQNAINAFLDCISDVNDSIHECEMCLETDLETDHGMQLSGNECIRCSREVTILCFPTKALPLPTVLCRTNIATLTPTWLTPVTSLQDMTQMEEMLYAFGSPHHPSLFIHPFPYYHIFNTVS